jgi:hypothetical protein
MSDRYQRGMALGVNRVATIARRFRPIVLRLFSTTPSLSRTRGDCVSPTEGIPGAEVVDDSLLLVVGVAGDDAREQVPRSQNEFHDDPTPRGRRYQHRLGQGSVNRPNSGPASGTQAQSGVLFEGRRTFFALRPVPALIVGQSRRCRHPGQATFGPHSRRDSRPLCRPQVKRTKWNRV